MSCGSLPSPLLHVSQGIIEDVQEELCVMFFEHQGRSKSDGLGATASQYNTLARPKEEGKSSE